MNTMPCQKNITKNGLNSKGQKHRITYPHLENKSKFKTKTGGIISEI